MIHEEELMKLCENDIDLFLDIRSIFEQQYKGSGSTLERKVLIEFIQMYPDILEYEFDDYWKDFKYRYKSEYPEKFI